MLEPAVKDTRGMIPVIALVGRPNVGKSTLFNRLTRSRDALVANLPGLTRDRQYGKATIGGQACIVIDTGGITGEESGIDAEMARQSLLAIEEADAVVFMLDARDGLTAADEMLAQHLRRSRKPVFFVANKIDGVDPDVASADFFRLGIERLYPMTATHGGGVRALMADVLAPYALPVDSDLDGEGGDAEDSGSGEPADAVDPAVAVRAVRIAVVGRPNVGKSTLVNRILGEQRVVVFDQPGTTRDSIYIDYERDGRPYTLIDTAGIRRRKNISEAVEKFSIVKTLKAIDDANVVILMMDASEGIVEQDLHLLGHTVDAGRALVVAVNKWDGLDEEHRRDVRRELDRRLSFLDFAEVHFISALHGSGVGNLYQSIDNAYRSATLKLSTPRLTQILQDAVADHPPPLINGRRIKLRYAHAGGSNPPLIVIHGNQTDKVPANYQRYLEKIYRRELDLFGTPLKVEFRSGDNPYAGRKNTLSARQQAKRKRLVKHLKKASR